MTHGEHEREHEHEGDPLRALLAALTAKPPPVVLLDVRHDRECPAPERGGLACRCQPEVEVRVYLARWPDWPAGGRGGTRRDAEGRGGALTSDAEEEETR